MFFILSKVLAFFINPFFLCLVSFFLWLFLKHRVWKKVFLYLSISFVFLFTNPLITGKVTDAWSTNGIEIPEGKQYDVGILLGGMGKYNPQFKRPALNAEGDRIWQTLELYHAGKIHKILISSFNGSLIHQESNEARMFKEQLVSWGIKASDIIIEDKSRNTHENAKFTKELLTKSYPHLKRIVLITSTLHMRRAKACFQKQEMDILPYATGLSGEGPISYMDYIIPDASNFEVWKQLLKEMTGYAAYMILGYL